MIKKIPTEHEEQTAFVEWLRLQYPAMRFFAIPNGMRTSFSQAKKAKREGVSSGVPDIYIPYLRLWVEMKRVKGGVVSPEQKEWHNYLTEHCGDTVVVARGCSEAVKAVVNLTQGLGR